MYDLREEVNDDALVDRFTENWRSAGLPEHTLAALSLAEKLTLTPDQMTQEDIQGLRGYGYSDEDIHDIVQIAAFFNYINRLAGALGVPPEDFMTPWPRQDGEW